MTDKKPAEKDAPVEPAGGPNPNQHNPAGVDATLDLDAAAEAAEEPV